MMKKPAIPKPTAAYMAAKRAECKKASPCDECPPNLVDDDKAKAKEEMREQAPFWMSQAALSYTVPDSGIDQGSPSGPAPPQVEHNGVVFDESLAHVNTMNGGGQVFGAVGKYLAMGSFFNNPENKPDPGATWLLSPNLMGRYFLVKAEKDYSISNPESCVSPPDIMGATLFAPAGSFILSFSGTVGSEPQSVQDGLLGFPNPKYLLDEYQTYEKMLDAHQKMFDGVHATMCNNPMKGVTEALEDAGFVKGGSSDKEITVVGHSLGGAQAQLAAVQIAKVYKAKVRVITFESILAFTPEGAQKVVDDFIVGPDGVPDVSGKAEPTTAFPPEGGKITAQRWVEDDSPLTAAPLLYGAGFAPVCCPLPFLCPCNFFCPSFWKNKLELVGCWPFNQNLGKGYLSKALVTSVSLKVRAPCGCCQKKSKVGPYPNDAFEFFISDKRSYVSKAARRLGCVGNFLCESARAVTNHRQQPLLWELYKGAYQNKFRTNGNTVSQYVPKVQKVTP